jgi:hypothetical protein
MNIAASATGTLMERYLKDFINQVVKVLQVKHCLGSAAHLCTSMRAMSCKSFGTSIA